jgi:hypothetical protein
MGVCRDAGIVHILGNTEVLARRDSKLYKKTVGIFPELKHTQIYVVRQLAYSTELLVCINQA